MQAKACVMLAEEMSWFESVIALSLLEMRRMHVMNFGHRNGLMVPRVEGWSRCSIR